MFNLFSGRAVNRKPLVASKLPELTELPELVPIGEELILPELVPIGGEQFPELVPILPESKSIISMLKNTNHVLRIFCSI